MKTLHRIHGIYIFVLMLLFMTYDQLIRVAPEVVKHEFFKGATFSSDIYGLMPLFAVCVYLIVQTPAGILFDHVRLRILLPAAILCSSLALFMMAWSDKPIFGVAIKALLMVAAPFAFLGVLILAARWFSHKSFATLAGVAHLFSTLGILIAGVPLTFLLKYYLSWRVVMIILGTLGLILILMCLMVLQENSLEKRKGSYFKEFKHLFTSPQMWAINLYTFCGWGPIVVFANLWGGAFVHQRFGVSIREARDILVILWLAVGLLAPIIGYFSDKIQKRRLLLVISSGLGALCSLLFYYGGGPLTLGDFLLLGIGIAGAGQILTQAYVKDISPATSLGVALGLNITFAIAGGVVTDLFSHSVLTFFSKGADGLYSLGAYQVALSIHPFLFLVGLGIALFALKETRCKALGN